MDASLVNAGYGAISGAITASANRSVAATLAGASNNIRMVNNQTARVVAERDAVLTGMQRWAQNVRNQRTYESIAQHQEALTINFNRARDTRTRQNFAANVAEAEEQGRFAAAAAASGVTGSVVDIIDSTAALKRNMIDAARVEQENQAVYDERNTEFRTQWALMDQMDYGLIFDAQAKLDYGTTQTQQTPGVLSSAIGGMGVKGLQAIGTSLGNFFSSPSGGSSSLDGFLALNDNFGTSAK